MKLTKLTALLETAKIWRELAESGGACKPYYANSQFEYGCPCCEFVCQQVPSEWVEGMSCAGARSAGDKAVLSLCPMKTLWPSGCCKRTSPFERWDRAITPKTRSKYAQIIADTAARLARQLRRKKGKK